MIGGLTNKLVLSVRYHRRKKGFHIKYVLYMCVIISQNSKIYMCLQSFCVVRSPCLNRVNSDNFPAFDTENSLSNERYIQLGS